MNKCKFYRGSPIDGKAEMLVIKCSESKASQFGTSAGKRGPYPTIAEARAIAARNGFTPRKPA